MYVCVRVYVDMCVDSLGSACHHPETPVLGFQMHALYLSFTWVMGI